ncbi:MAG: GTPase ObgE [Ureaplasma sp.]|nr:GTPase ObgE [Ureaplasma sp.]
MSFIDKCDIYIKAGNGGNGAVAWRREAHVPRGGPAGGNGGNGGSIYFVGNRNETSLDSLKFKKNVIAKNGENGDIKSMHGANADDLFIQVPLGTVIYDKSTMTPICDIKKDNEKYLVAKGGRGGHGNAHFKSSFNKAPSLHENGEIGQSFNLHLELKEIADIGIVGFPNAGKSSLISVLTNAKPKIANYQFTTLVPILGTIDFNEDKKIVIADIPGLIENASEGSGLGFEFLKHIERCKILIHLISLDKYDNEDIVNSYLQIMTELKKYNIKMLDKKIIVVANKNDVDDAKEQLEKLEKFLNQKIISISCLDKENISEFKDILIKEYVLMNLESSHEIEPIKWTNNFDEAILNETLEVSKISDTVWEVKCEYLEYWTNRIPLDTPDNIIRYNQKISKLNLESQLYELGANSSDTIMIYGNEVVFNE